MKRITDFIKHPLFSGSFIMFSGSMVVNVVNYFYHLIMGRVLGPVNYGVLASIFSVLYIVTIIPSSASISIVKFIASAKNKTERSHIYWAINKFVFRLALVLSLIVIFVSPFISNFLNIPDKSIIILVAPILFFSIITLVNMSTLQGVLKFFGVVGPSLTSALGKLIFGLALVFLGYSVFGAIWGVAIGAILAYVLSVFQIKGTVVRKSASKKYELGDFIKYSFPVLLQSFAFTSFFTTDVILVKHFLSPYDAGIYAAISTLGKIIFFASSPIAGAMFPIVSQRHAKGERYFKILLISLLATVLISVGICTFYFVFPRITVELLYGSKYILASSYLAWMGLFVAFYSISSLLTNFFLSIGKIKVVFYSLTGAVLQGVGIFVWHDSIGTVIRVSLYLMVLLTLVLVVHLRYNR